MWKVRLTERFFHLADFWLDGLEFTSKQPQV